jgi:hypothetical protein
VKRAFQSGLLGVLMLGAGLAVTGCKSAPPLSQADAQKMIEAYYEQQPPASVNIYVDSTGLRQGFDAKYWKLTKVYPNKRWADYDLTDDGKKTVKLDAGNTIQWRPDDQGKAHFYVTTVQANRPVIKEVSDPQDDVVPGVETAKSCKFTVDANLTGLPNPLQQMAHNEGNILSERHTAEFALENSAWKIHDVR